MSFFSFCWVFLLLSFFSFLFNLCRSTGWLLLKWCISSAWARWRPQWIDRAVPLLVRKKRNVARKKKAKQKKHCKTTAILFVSLLLSFATFLVPSVPLFWCILASEITRFFGSFAPFFFSYFLPFLSFLSCLSLSLPFVCSFRCSSTFFSPALDIAQTPEATLRSALRPFSAQTVQLPTPDHHTCPVRLPSSLISVSQKGYARQRMKLASLHGCVWILFFSMKSFVGVLAQILLCFSSCGRYSFLTSFLFAYLVLSHVMLSHRVHSGSLSYPIHFKVTLDSHISATVYYNFLSAAFSLVLERIPPAPTHGLFPIFMRTHPQNNRTSTTLSGPSHVVFRSRDESAIPEAKKALQVGGCAVCLCVCVCVCVRERERERERGRERHIYIEEERSERARERERHICEERERERKRERQREKTPVIECACHTMPFLSVIEKVYQYVCKYL